MLKQWNVPHESPKIFWKHFRLLMFEALTSQMKFQYLMDIFEYCCHKSICPKVKKNFKPCSACFGDGVVKYQVDIVDVTSDHPPSPNQIAPPLQSHVGENAHETVQLLHSPTLTRNLSMNP